MLSFGLSDRSAPRIYSTSSGSVGSGLGGVAAFLWEAVCAEQRETQKRNVNAQTRLRRVKDPILDFSKGTIGVSITCYAVDSFTMARGLVRSVLSDGTAASRLRV